MYLLLAQNPALDCHGCFELWLRRDILSSRYGAILFFSPFLKLLDCCWIVFLLPQGTNWAIQRSAAKQTDADEMRGSSSHWYLVSNNPDDVFANVTDEQQRRLGLVVVCSAICQMVEFPNFLPQHYFLPCQPCQRRLVYFHSSWKPPMNYSSSPFSLS